MHPLHTTAAPSSHLSEALRALSQSEETSLFMTLLASFKILLARYTSQDVIPVGTPIAGAPDSLPDQILLPLCTDLSGNPSFREAQPDSVSSATFF